MRVYFIQPTYGYMGKQRKEKRLKKIRIISSLSEIFVVCLRYNIKRNIHYP